MTDEEQSGGGRSSSSRRRGPGRPSNRERAETLSDTIATGLRGVADLLERRDELEEADSFAAVIRRDAERQAEWLAALASRYSGAERVLQAVFGAGSVIGAAGAFGPLVSLLVDRVRLSGLLDWSSGDEPEAGEPEPAAGAGDELERPAGAAAVI